MTFIASPDHDIVSSEVTSDLGFFVFRTDEGLFSFLRDNRDTLRILNVHENLDVNYHFTLTITNKK